MKYILIISLIIFSCETSDRFAIYSRLDVDVYNVDTLTVQCSNSGNNNIYKIGENTYQYQIDFQSLETNLKINRVKEDLMFKDSIQILLNDQKITLYKFLANSNSFDGETAHYFTRHHGLLLIKSTTWRSQISLFPWSQSLIKWSGLESDEKNDKIDNNQLEQLDSIIKNDLEK